MFNVVSSATGTLMATCSDIHKATLVRDALNKTSPWHDNKFEIEPVLVVSLPSDWDEQDEMD